ncbi:MAG: ABC transporter ATP-binding protein [Anaerolineales bacterium]|nr:ABC transporter ATP-binding protein [Anaerolineales bacterium]
MSELAIRVDRLSKRYRIGQGARAPYKTLRESLVGLLAAPVNRLRSKTQARDGEDHIWALKDVSFEVNHGEVVGIIGRNGAGKSTLLKILSRITEPTGGSVDLYGRVGSLLEVGTGFHPELTGRENIYLNGAILGMRRAEIERKFDEIVAFAEVEKFIDTPVKFYSSGMYVRLAFAVAAHLEPEILLVDEVLAVGDAAFQKKCLGKMGDVAKEGRTVLFVSHNMTAIRNLCERVIWLHEGQIRQKGSTIETTEAYLQQTVRVDSMADIDRLIKLLPEDPAIRLEVVRICQDDKEDNFVFNGKPVDIELKYCVLQRTTGLRVYFDLLDEEQNILIRSFHDDEAEAIPTMDVGNYTSVGTIPARLLAPRRYEIRIRATIYNVRSCTGDGLSIPIIVESSGTINRGYPHDVVRSKIQPQITWRTWRCM